MAYLLLYFLLASKLLNTSVPKACHFFRIYQYEQYAGYYGK